MTYSQLIKISQVTQLTALSTSSIYRFIREGRFPKPIKLSERASAWRLEDIEAWIAARVADSLGDGKQQEAA